MASAYPARTLACAPSIGGSTSVRPTAPVALAATGVVTPAHRHSRPKTARLPAPPGVYHRARRHGSRSRGVLPGCQGARPALRRTLPDRGAVDGDLLPADLSRPDAEGRELRVLSDRGGGVLGRVQTLSPLSARGRPGPSSLERYGGDRPPRAPTAHRGRAGGREPGRARPAARRRKPALAPSLPAARRRLAGGRRASTGAPFSPSN